MIRIGAYFFAFSVSAFSTHVLADTLFLESQIRATRQACFTGAIEGYVSEFDGRDFTIYVLLYGCDEAKKPPIMCTPYVAAQEDPIPTELRTLIDKNTVVLKYKFDKGEINLIDFNSSVGSVCIENGLKPKHRKNLPDIVWVAPTMVSDRQVVDLDALDPKGLIRPFWGIDWSNALKSKNSLEIQDSLNIELPASGMTKVSVNEKITVGGVIKVQKEWPQFYLVNGTIEKVNTGSIVMKVTDIVEATQKVPHPRFPHIYAYAALSLGSMDNRIGPVMMNIRHERKASFGWHAKLRDVEEEVQLEVHRIYWSNGRLVDVDVGKRFDRNEEVLWLMRRE